MLKKIIRVSSVAVLCLLTLFTAASTGVATEYKLAPPKWPNATRIVVLSNGETGFKEGKGAGCPIADEGKDSTFLIVTAKHVAEHSPLVIKSFDGRVLGRATLKWASSKRDLAIMVSDVPLPGIHLAEEAPAYDDPVMVLGQGLEEDGWVNHFYRGYVVGIQSAMKRPHLATWTEAGPGSSGSCVLNENGEVLGIDVLARWWNEPVKQVMLAEILWGGWDKE